MVFAPALRSGLRLLVEMRCKVSLIKFLKRLKPIAFVNPESPKIPMEIIKSLEVCDQAWVPNPVNIDGFIALFRATGMQFDKLKEIK